MSAAAVEIISCEVESVDDVLLQLTVVPDPVSMSYHGKVFIESVCLINTRRIQVRHADRQALPPREHKVPIVAFFLEQLFSNNSEDLRQSEQQYWHVLESASQLG
jgi:hypothetical protein